MVVRAAALPFVAFFDRRRSLQDRLNALLETTWAENALALASPSLWTAAQGQLTSDVVGSLCRYLCRAASRATPFGYFTSVGILTHGYADFPQLSCERRTFVRLHRRFALAVAKCALSGMEEAGRELLVTLNSSATVEENTVRFLEPHDKDTATLQEIELTPALQLVVDKSAQAVSIGNLVQEVTGAFDEVCEKDVRGFLASLCRRQLLYPAFWPRVVGDLALRGWCDALSQVAPSLGGAATRALEVCQALERGEVTVPVAQERLNAVIVELPGGRENPSVGGALFVETERNASLVRSRHPMNDRDFVEAASLLLDLGQPSKRLVDWADGFEKRFEGQRVPLLRAIDEEKGVAFDLDSSTAFENQPLLRGLSFQQDDGAALHLTAKCLVLHRIARTSNDLVQLRGHESLSELLSAVGEGVQLRGAGFAFCNLLRGQTRHHLRLVGSGESVRLISRHQSPQVQALVDELWNAEELDTPPGWVRADIAFGPEALSMSLCLRPRIRNVSVEYMGHTASGAEPPLRIDDLSVFVENGGVVVWSERHQRRLMLTVGSSFNPMATCYGPYRFLCAVAQQYETAVSWDWGGVETLVEQLPRVQWGTTVLAAARWKLSENVWHEVGLKRGMRLTARHERKIRQHLGLPRYVELHEGDNALVCDLDDGELSRHFWAYARKKSNAWLHECLRLESAIAAEHAGLGDYAHELVIPIKEPLGEVGEPAMPPPRYDSVCAARADQDWTTWEIYGAPGAMDTIAKTVSDELSAAGVERWFFLRYNDPSAHIRARAAGLSARHRGTIEERLRAHVGDLFSRVAVVDYMPEYRRYGGTELIDTAHDVFVADSKWVYELMLSSFSEDERWLVTAASMCALCRSFGLSDEAEYDFYDTQRRSFRGEFGAARQDLQAVAQRHRDHRSALDELTINPEDAIPLKLRTGFRSWLEAMHRAAASYENTHKSVKEYALASYVHMHVNRRHLSPRASEFVLYELLARAVRSALGRTGRTS